MTTQKTETPINENLLTYAKLNRTKLKPGSGHLLRHPARKQIGPILQLPGPHRVWHSIMWVAFLLSICRQDVSMCVVQIEA